MAPHLVLVIKVVRTLDAEDLKRGAQARKVELSGLPGGRRAHAYARAHRCHGND